MRAEPTPGTPDPLVGRKVGGYAVTRRIGQGGMGIVYEAKHERITQQRAAIKVLHKELSSDEKVLQRFFMEAKAISMAQHSSIVKIFDFGQLDDGTAYIMMEFLDGEPLQSRMERAQQQHQSLPLGQVIELGRQSATALAVIHEKNIVHRDLKPENIFVVPDPVAPLGERVKLLDFGIAKFLDGPVRKTTVGMILGTPLYMSPEQCEGSEDLDAKVDVYALGVMLYEMIAGHLPFTADTAAALMRQHMFKEPPPLAEQVPGLPPALTELVHKMLAKVPAERPKMTEIAARLDEIMLGIGDLQGGPHALSSANITARRRALAQSGEGALDPFAKTMGGATGGPADAFASTLAEPASSASGKLRRDGGGSTSMPGVSHSSLDGAKPAAAAQPVSLTLGQSRDRRPLLIAVVVLALLATSTAVLLRPKRPPPTTAAVLPPVPRAEPDQRAPGPANPTPTVAEKPTAVPTTVSTTAPAGEPDPHEARPKKRKGTSKKAAPAAEPEDKKTKPKPPTPEKGGADGEVWR